MVDIQRRQYVIHVNCSLSRELKLSTIGHGHIGGIAGRSKMFFFSFKFTDQYRKNERWLSWKLKFGNWERGMTSQDRRRGASLLSAAAY